MDSRAGWTTAQHISAEQSPLAAAVLLAPFGHGDPEGGLTAPTAIILPACDRDLAGLAGQTYDDRERVKPELQVPVVSVLQQWANHNGFNGAKHLVALADAPEPQREGLFDRIQALISGGALHLP